MKEDIEKSSQYGGGDPGFTSEPVADPGFKNEPVADPSESVDPAQPSSSGVPTQARKQKKVAPVKHQIRREKSKMKIRI